MCFLHEKKCTLIFFIQQQKKEKMIRKKYVKIQKVATKFWFLIICCDSNLSFVQTLCLVKCYQNPYALEPKFWLKCIKMCQLILMFYPRVTWRDFIFLNSPTSWDNIFVFLVFTITRGCMGSYVTGALFEPVVLLHVLKYMTVYKILNKFIELILNILKYLLTILFCNICT